MGRWTQYDEDSYRLPRGVERTGYDADTGTYHYRDTLTGQALVGEPGTEFGVLRPANEPHTSIYDRELLEQAKSDRSPPALSHPSGGARQNMQRIKGVVQDVVKRSATVARRRPADHGEKRARKRSATDAVSHGSGRCEKGMHIKDPFTASSEKGVGLSKSPLAPQTVSLARSKGVHPNGTPECTEVTVLSETVWVGSSVRSGHTRAVTTGNGSTRRSSASSASTHGCPSSGASTTASELRHDLSNDLQEKELPELPES